VKQVGRLAGTLAVVGMTAPLVLAAPAAPAPAPAAATSSAAVGLLQTSVSLVFVLAVILGLAWIAKRLRLAPGRRSGALIVLAEVPVGPKERVVLLKVGDGQALVGVGADGVRSLTLLAQNVAVSQAAPETSFAARLNEALGRGAKS